MATRVCRAAGAGKQINVPMGKGQASYALSVVPGGCRGDSIRYARTMFGQARNGYTQQPVEGLSSGEHLSLDLPFSTDAYKCAESKLWR